MIDNLFSEYSAEQVFQGRRKQAYAYLDGIGSAIRQLTEAEISQVCEDVENQFGITVATLLLDQIEATGEPGLVDARHLPGPRLIVDFSQPCMIQGFIYTVRVPYEGDRESFLIKPSIYGPPKPNRVHALTDGHVILTYPTDVTHDATVVGNEIRSYLARIKQWLDYVRDTIGNTSIYGAALSEIRSRRESMVTSEANIKSMGFHLMRREDAPQTYRVPVKRNRIEPKFARTFDTADPEPELSDADYDVILDVIANMAQVMERSPSAFQEMREEDLRSHFLVQLNGQFEGAATGETFNFDGKTDILIRIKGKNIFIAECKFWSGESQLLETVNQILGYLSWRDTKTAIILFNRNRKFSAVLSNIPIALQTHSSFKKYLGTRHESQFKVVLRHQQDTDKDVLLTVLAFDVPT
jgi:hypothetical protein